MTQPLLHGEAPPNEVAFVLAWLLPITGVDLPLTAPFTLDPNTVGVGAERWEAGMILPYRSVTVFPVHQDLISSYSIVRVHTFGDSYEHASDEADKTHSRMLVLADDPLTDVLMADGSIANCQSLGGEHCIRPHKQPYAAESVVTHFVSEYDLALRFTRTT